MRRILFTVVMSWLSLAVSLSQSRKEAAMPVSGNVIVAPVNIDDVRRVLGDSSRDVGTLCTSSRVNRYSRKKPYRYSSVAPVNFDKDLTTTSGMIWGLKPIINSGESFFNTMVAAFFKSIPDALNTYGDWGYQRPTGGISSPYRLSDFDGYHHGVSFPYSQGVSGHETPEDGSLIVVNLFDEKKLTFFVSGNPNSDFVHLKDFFSVYQDHRFIVELYAASSESDEAWRTARPAKVFASARNISEITNWTEYIELDIVQDMELSNWDYAVVLFGLGKISTGSTIPRMHLDGILPFLNFTVIPFYRKIKIESHFSRDVNIVRYRFGLNNTNWYTPTETPPSIYRGTPAIHMELQIEKGSSALTIPSSNLNLRALTYGTLNNSDTGYGSNSNGQDEGSLTIASGSTGTYQNIYWMFDNLITSPGTVSGIAIQVSVDGDKTWETVATVSLYTEFG